MDNQSNNSKKIDTCGRDYPVPKKPKEMGYIICLESELLHGLRSTNEINKEVYNTIDRFNTGVSDLDEKLEPSVDSKSYHTLSPKFQSDFEMNETSLKIEDPKFKNLFSCGLVNDFLEYHFGNMDNIDEKIIEHIKKSVSQLSKDDVIIKRELDFPIGSDGVVVPFEFLSYRNDELYGPSFVAKIPKNQGISLNSDCIAIPYQRNVAPIRILTENNLIDTNELPDDKIESFTYDPRGDNIMHNILIMKYHKMTVEKFLEERIDEFTTRKCILYINEIIQGASHIYKHNVIHRDLHWGNILIDPRTSRLRIADFGLSIDTRSRRLDNSQDKKERFKFLIKDDLLRESSGFVYFGAPIFTPPEVDKSTAQTDGKIDFSKADIYSCGVNGKLMIEKLLEKKDLSDDDKEILKNLKREIVDHLIEDDPDSRWDLEDLTKFNGEISKFLKECKREIFYMIEIGRGRWFFKKANKFFIRTKFHAAIQELDKTLTVLEKLKGMSLKNELSLHDNDVRYLNVNIANVYFTRGINKEYIFDYEQSKKDFKKCIEVRVELENVNEGFRIKNELEIAECRNRIGGLYVRLKKFEKAEKILNKSLVFRSRYLACLEHEDIAHSYLNFALLYMEKREFELSNEYFEKAMTIFENCNKKKNNSDVAYTKHLFGQMLFYSEDYEKSQEFLEDCFEMRKLILPACHPKIGFCLHDLGIVHIRRGNIVEGMKCLIRALGVFICLPSQPSSPKKLVDTTLGNIQLICEHVLKDTQIYERINEWQSGGMLFEEEEEMEGEGGD